MLKLIANPTFKSKVSVTVQGGEAHILEVEFRHMTKDAADDLFRDSTKQLSEKLLAIVAGWSGLEFELSEKGLKDMDQQYPAVGPQIISGYVDNLALGRSGN